MTDLHTAAKQALEALEKAVIAFGPGLTLQERAITALRQALANEALDKKAENAREIGLDYEPVCNKDPQGCWNVRCQLGKKCKNTPAQPMPDAFEQLMREADKPTQVPEGIAKYVDALVKGTHEITSVTIRPKRTWVSLTNNELQPIADEYRILFGSWVEDFARAIEAKLKEKNDG